MEGEEEIKLGNPWSILPIKNNKYARDLVEVHLSDRMLTGCEHFEDFPNLEEIWLNNNSLENLDDIQTNFRCKRIYCQDNIVENINGIRGFKFLELLLLNNNKLRNLDKFLVSLTKFAFLQQLDLNGNPLAEEPDYRLKIIYLMPQVKILDRHVITVAERIKAKQICEQEYDFSNIIKAKQAVNNKDKGYQAKKVKTDGFSTGERDLYKGFGQIQKRLQGEKELEETKRQKFFETQQYGKVLPIPSKKQENKDSFGQNIEVTLTEWEKNQVKEVFFKYDTDKTGVSKDNLVQVVLALMKDECIIGKIPNLQEDEIPTLFDAWGITDETKCKWQQFTAGLNNWLWRLQDRERLQEMVDEFFALSLKYKMQGKDEDSKAMATKALRLEGSLTKCKPMDVPSKGDGGLPKRGDFLVIKKHRRTEQDPEALLPTDDFNDKTLTKKF